MPLLYDVVDALEERDRKKRRRRYALLLLLALVATFTAMFWERGREVVAAVASEVGMRRVEVFADEIQRASRESDVDPYLLAAIMYSESRGRIDAKSSAGALGLMQLAPSAASDAARRLGLPAPSEEDLLSEAELNIRLGARHLAWLFDHQGDMDLEQLLICYNAGRTKFFRWIKEKGGYGPWRREEAQLIHDGGKHTGSLTYAVNTINMRDHFESRGVIQP